MTDCPAAEPDDVDRLLEEWQRRATLHLVVFNKAANRSGRWNGILGWLTVALIALVGTSVFATLEHNVGLAARILVGSVGVVAAVLAVTLVVGRFPEHAEEYRKAGRRFGAIRREIEEARLLAPNDNAEIRKLLDHFRDLLDRAAEDSTNAPPGLWNKTDRQMKRQFTRWERAYAWLRGLKEPYVPGINEIGQGAADGGEPSA